MVTCELPDDATASHVHVRHSSGKGTLDRDATAGTSSLRSSVRPASTPRSENASQLDGGFIRLETTSNLADGLSEPL